MDDLLNPSYGITPLSSSATQKNTRNFLNLSAMCEINWKISTELSATKKTFPSKFAELHPSIPAPATLDPSLPAGVGGWPFRRLRPTVGNGEALMRRGGSWLRTGGCGGVDVRLTSTASVQCDALKKWWRHRTMCSSRRNGENGSLWCWTERCNYRQRISVVNWQNWVLGRKLGLGYLFINSGECYITFIVQGNWTMKSDWPLYRFFPIR